MRQLTLVATLGALSFLSCGPKTVDPELGITARPRTLENTGAISTIVVTATNELGAAGEGTIHLTSEAGAFTQGVDVNLVNGNASADFSCDIDVDATCIGIVRVLATWKLADKTIAQGVNLTITSGGIDAGNSDGGVTDGGETDGGGDAGEADAGEADAGGADAGGADAGGTDAGEPDAGAPTFLLTLQASPEWTVVGSASQIELLATYTIDGGPLVGELIDLRTTTGQIQLVDGGDWVPSTTDSNGQLRGWLVNAGSLGIDVITATTTDAGVAAAYVQVLPFIDSDAGVDDAGCLPPKLSGSVSSGFQLNAAHTGAQPDDELRLPLCKRWSRDLGAHVSYPVVVGGRVYVAGTLNSSQETKLWALDQFSGAIVWGPVDAPQSVQGAPPTIAYDSNRIFSIDSHCGMHAFDANTGALLWKGDIPAAFGCDSAPTAKNGAVFVSSANFLFALSQAGAEVDAGAGIDAGGPLVLWSDTPQGIGSPAVTDLAVFTGATGTATKFSLSGDQLWSWGNFVNGNRATLAVYADRVYGADFILDSATGQFVSSYAGPFIPAFNPTYMFTAKTTGVYAFRLDDGGVDWSMDAGASLAPLVIGGHVVVAEDATLYVLDANTGAILSTNPTNVELGRGREFLGQGTPGLAASNGMLFVPLVNGIEAY